MASKDEREKKEDVKMPEKALGPYGSQGDRPRKKRAVTGEPSDMRTSRVRKQLEPMGATPEEAKAVEKTIETTAKEAGEPGLADTFKEIAPFLVATALGGLDAGFQAQRGAMMSQSAQAEAKLRRRRTEAEIDALGQRAALQGSTDPNSPESVAAREMLRQQVSDPSQITDDMSEADINRFGRSLISKDTALIQERGRQKRSEANLEVRKKDQEFKERKFGFQQKKSSQLSDTQVKEITALDSAINDIERLESLKQGVDTGPLAGPAQTFLEVFDAAPKEFTKLKASSAAATLKLTKQLQGSRPSDMDLAYVERITPNTSDNDKVFAAKLDLLKDFVSKNKEVFEEAIVTGQPLRQIAPNLSQQHIMETAGTPQQELVGIKPRSQAPAKQYSKSAQAKINELRRRGFTDQQIQEALRR